MHSLVASTGMTVNVQWTEENGGGLILSYQPL